MYYETSANDHGLPFNPFKAIVAPRPIGWISSRGQKGEVNLAPYSFFNAVGDTPPMVMFSSSGFKDTVTNIQATGEFVCNMASYDLREAMNTTSAPMSYGVSEFAAAGLTMAPSNTIDVPRVAEAFTALECKLLSLQEMKDLKGHETGSFVVFGQVVAVHIDDRVLTNGLLDLKKVRPLARLGYKDYAVVDDLFQIERPKA